MLFQLTPDDALKAIQSVSDDFPEAMEQIFSRVPEEQRIRTMGLILPHIPEGRRLEVLNLTPDDMIQAIESVPEAQRIETLNRLKALISEDQLKKWARELLDGKK